MLIYSCMSLFLESNKVGESGAAAKTILALL